MTDIQWEKPPPVEGRPYHRHELIAAQLRQRKGQWGHVATYKSRASANTAAQAIRVGRFAAYDAGDYEAVRREVDGEHRVYARYLGDGDE